MSSALVARIPLARPKAGSNPGFYVKRLEARCAALEAENATLRASMGAKAPRIVRGPAARPASDADAMRAAYMALSPFDVDMAEYQGARTAYLLAAYGTTNAKALRNLAAQGIRSEPVLDVERPKAGLVEVVHGLLESV